MKEKEKEIFEWKTILASLSSELLQQNTMEEKILAPLPQGPINSQNFFEQFSEIKSLLKATQEQKSKQSEAAPLEGDTHQQLMEQIRVLTKNLESMNDTKFENEKLKQRNKYLEEILTVQVTLEQSIEDCKKQLVDKDKIIENQQEQIKELKLSHDKVSLFEKLLASSGERKFNSIDELGIHITQSTKEIKDLKQKLTNSEGKLKKSKETTTTLKSELATKKRELKEQKNLVSKMESEKEVRNFNLALEHKLEQNM